VVHAGPGDRPRRPPREHRRPLGGPPTGSACGSTVARPGEEFVAGETVCAELLTADSCTTITARWPPTAGSRVNTAFLTDATLEVASDAALGNWQLRFSVVDVGTSEVYFSDTFVTIGASD
jgi:hypothetical protein